MEHMIRQNNAIDIHSMYFEGDQPPIGDPRGKRNEADEKEWK